MVGLFGGLAGAASVYGNTPIDVVKTRMQVSRIILLDYQFRSCSTHGVDNSHHILVTSLNHVYKNKTVVKDRFTLQIAL